MRLRRPNTPQHYGVPCDVICRTLLTSFPMICQPYNSNLYFLDLYRKNLIFLLCLFFYFTSNLFDQIKTFQTNIWSSGYIHIYSNHLWSLRNKDFHYTLITSLINIHPYAWFSIRYARFPKNGVLVILQVSKDQNLRTRRSIWMELFHWL